MVEIQVSLSLVVPVYAGESYLRALANAVAEQRETWRKDQYPFAIAELIFVDDDARDGSTAVIDAIAQEYPWVVPLHLSRNFGQHAATIAGILHSSGDWVVTLDEDMQHPPERILSLLREAVTTQSDIVYANAESSVHNTWMRDATSRLFKRFMQWITGNVDLRYFNSFRLIRGSVARAAGSVCAHDTYLDVALSWFSKRIGVVVMDLKDTRYIETGKSGYNFRSLLSHAWRMLFSSQIKLLRLGAAIGFTIMSAAVVISLYFLGLRLINPAAIQVQGWASLLLLISFFGGLSAFMLGIALQYLSTLVLKAHGKPTFFTIDRSVDRSLATWFADHSYGQNEHRAISNLKEPANQT